MPETKNTLCAHCNENNYEKLTRKRTSEKLVIGEIIKCRMFFVEFIV